MKCPIDNTDLQMSERQSIEIDYCPKCRGIWLDRGELDKIIGRVQENELASGSDAPPLSTDQRQYPPQPYLPPQPYYGKHGRRKSLLGELFDF